MRMTDEEVAEFLEAGRRIQVATLMPSGAVHLVPLSYVMIDGLVTLWTDRDSQKTANLRRDPRITCLLEVGEQFEEFRAVQIRGTAELLDDEESSLRTGYALFARSGPAGQTEEAKGYARGLAGLRVTIVVHPEHVVSWDHRKMLGVLPHEIGK
jgi:nitroimidazol reductase NimA-like FMN-containing flavoprotein (pyridoxamine 5'-phosphate oxidase superfamily)